MEELSGNGILKEAIRIPFAVWRQSRLGVPGCTAFYYFRKSGLCTRFRFYRMNGANGYNVACGRQASQTPRNKNILLHCFMNEREKIIQNYIAGYNAGDIEKTTADLDAELVFENISNGQSNMLLRGRAAFTQQATAAKNYFSTRRQTIRSFRHLDDETEIELEYSAVEIGRAHV